MKNFTLLFFILMSPLFAVSQSYSTGDVQLLNTAGLEYSARMDVDATEVTLTLTGPATRWLGIGFGQNTMASGGDVVIFDGTALTDRQFLGIGIEPELDDNQDWTVTSNTVAGGVRTVVGTRAVNTGEAGDYVFSAAPNSIPLVYARGESLVVQYHGSGNCGATTANLTLGTDKFSIADSQIFPNPATTRFAIKSPVIVENINIYTHTGAFVKSVEIDSDEESISVSGLAKGVYLIELKNEDATTWKKVIIN